ncbi:MAG: hydrogen peroxide-dependent heme synthase [Rhodoluna sp.]
MVNDQTELPTRISAREINETIRYTTWTALHQVKPLENASRASLGFTNLLNELAEQDVQLRGAYDVSALRADAELVLWFHAPTAELIQMGLRKFAKTELGKSFTPVWSAMGLHRPAEFNKGHVPAFMTGAEAKDWLCIYPFVRSYEWYLLPEEERRAMLIEHGMAGRDFKGILSNTVSSFALGDYEWLLALESNELHEIVDMMRELRATKARMHVREEIPFYTGRKINNEHIGDLFA